MRVSQGQLKLFQTCALQWRFKYLDGVTGVQSCALTYGALIHQALELMETTADPAKAIQWFREAWGCPEAIDPALRIQQYLPNRNYRYYADRGPDLLRKWWNVIRWDPDVVLAREHHVIVPVTGTEHELEVVPDKVVARYSAKLEREVIVISDYKGLARPTPLPTPTGWTTMGDVAVGDQLIGGDGRPCRVVGKSSVHLRKCYRITFDDGTSIAADNEHLWEVHVGYREPYDVKVLATEDLNDNLRNPITGQRQLRIPYVGLDLPDVALPLDPYVLGAWLGDGAARGGLLTKGLPALFEEVERRGFEVGPDISGRNKATPERTVYGLTTILRSMGLLHDKHVPAAYLRAGRRQRLDLLRGIMDTDGHWNAKRKRCVLNTTSKRFADDTRELALSLGYGARTFKTRAQGFGLEVDAWQTWFTPHDEVFIARRPLDFRRQAPSKSTRRMIRSVELIPTVETQCVEVDSPRNTFLCGDQMVLTHNSGAEHNRPKRGYLAHDIQFSAYAYATTQPEFWEGVPNGGYYYERYRDAPRFGEWVQLTSSKRWDAGERREVPHYNRLRYAINTMAEMVALRLFPPTISGESCEFCFARAQCGLAPVEQERAA